MHPCIFCTSFLIVKKESHKIPLPQRYSVEDSLARIKTFLKIVLGRYHMGVFRLEARLAVKRGVFLGLGEGGVSCHRYESLSIYTLHFSEDIFESRSGEG